MADELLVVRDLALEFPTYEGVLRALSGVNFSMRRGEWLGLVGETGCGKSVTAHAIMRLLPPSARIVHGEICFEGTDLVHAPEEVLRNIRGRRIGMVFQDPGSALNPGMTIGQQLIETIRHHEELNERASREKAIHLLEQVGIVEPHKRIDAYPHELSGGMQQRVCIALALAPGPRLLIADEPTTALDVTVQAEILQLMVRLSREYGMAVLLITHDLGIVAHTCQRVAVMYAGRIVEVGAVSQVLQEPAHPYTRGLLAALPSVVRPIDRLEPIPGRLPDLTAPPVGCYFAERCPQFLGDQCASTRPAPVELSVDHQVACHLYAVPGDRPVGGRAR